MNASTTPASKFAGSRPASIPVTQCTPSTGSICGRSRVGTDPWAGSTATTVTLGLLALRKRPVPEIVPPVPIAATRMSTAPSVSRQISGPVVSWWMRGLAGLERWSV
ncbi:hypothetical protein NS228_20825 [Methylobacterium indicum]|nr:hypothetical protein NS228_20825 [Methylobacterium indicum]KTS49707.1 hypothetical protein NS230_17350 [Methylobacterium indicum]